ncbi:MAG: AhpC/TSA family protein [Tannerella sp.]|jgi:thiol-disulfide isomerase/thioredoxin|nr:AhpC/TSA family protein [Tannerella sp.]
MRKYIFLTLMAALMLAACTSSQNKYVVDGIVLDESFEKQTASLYDYDTDSHIAGTLVADGKFQFKGNIEKAKIMRLELGQYVVDFILESGKITLDLSNPVNIKIEGSPLNNELSDYKTEMSGLVDAANEEIMTIMGNEDVDEATRLAQAQKAIEPYTAKMEDLISGTFNRNKDNVMGAFVLWNAENYLTEEQLYKLYADAGDLVSTFKPLEANAPRIAKFGQTLPGMQFTDFTIEKGNTDGSPASLSDYVGKGKYVLVDFWASWCGPCTAELPVLNEVYNKYKGKKFELLGVAVWDERDASLNAIKEHNTPWPQILDAIDTPTTLYGIRGIPHIILFGPDGKIIARNLRGEELKEKVAEVMN